MALLYKIAACVIPLLLCLRLHGTASHTPQQPPDGRAAGGEERPSLGGETGSAGQQLAATPQGEQATQGVLHSSGWFTDTLNVTTRPVVTWSRRTARHGHRRPSPLTSTTSKEKEEEEEEEEGRRQEEEEDDVLLTVKFMKEDHPLILDLHPARDLLAASYRESSGDATGDDTLPGETRAMPCEYQGVVRGEQEAWVALSVCGGLSGVVAVTLEGGAEVELLVEPSPGSTSPHQPHRVFSSTLLKLPQSTCGVKDTQLRAAAEDGSGNAATGEDRSTNASLSPPRRARRWAPLAGQALWFDKSTRFVELVLVADFSFYNTFGGQTRSRCKAIVNIVNAMYRPLGVVVVLSHLEVWEHGDNIQVTSYYEENLNHFKQYRRQMKEKEPHYNNDNTMLLTTVDFNGRTVGYAVVSGMCGIDNSAGVVQDKKKNHVGVVANTLSHEMGHNFGMNHDEDEKKRPCHCDSSVCVMSGTSSVEFKPHVQWSSCSRSVIQERRDSQSYECLRNVPTRMYPSSSCGDGVVDDGEQCDCGPAEFCDNPCCVAATCRLAVNASCASGPCCDTKKCQPKPAGVMCREAFTECDLPESCSGDSESCPEDVVKADGTPCRRGQGYCNEARCGSHEGLCHLVWGPSATVAEPACYPKLNTRGGTNGNCGFKRRTKTEFLPCDDGDTLCGSLQCLTHRQNVPLIKSMNFGNIDFKCYYIVSNARVPSKYWLTPDGAKCGDGKMCRQQKCVKVPEWSGDCRGGCSGHGMCNSRNHCHCDRGFAPPHCSERGVGGSIDSNRIGRSRYQDAAWEALFILSLIGVGAAILLCCLWSHVRRWWEARGRGSMLPCCARCLDACCCPLMSLISDNLCTRNKHQDVSKEAQAAWEQDKMICQVDLDLNDKESHTTSDFSRKIQLPSHHVHCDHPAKTTQSVDRPTYAHTVSVDSGCVTDGEETTVEEPLHSSVSMRSLVSVFKKFGTRTSPPPTEKDTSPPKTFEQQQSMPLRRLVVDPLVGSRRSRHGTPPPEHVKHQWRRSVSLDVQSTVTGCSGGAPTTPPPAPSSRPRQPMMPPGKTQPSLSISMQSKKEFNTRSVSPVKATQQKGKGPQNSGPKRPLLPPVRGPEGPPAAKPPKASAVPSKARAAGDVPPPCTSAGRVKDLAKKLEKL